MSCHEITTRSQLLNHLKEHVTLECKRCLLPLQVEAGEISFGNSQMVTAICNQCKQEEIFVIQENGEVLTFDESSLILEQ